MSQMPLLSNTSPLLPMMRNSVGFLLGSGVKMAEFTQNVAAKGEALAADGKISKGCFIKALGLTGTACLAVVMALTIAVTFTVLLLLVVSAVVLALPLLLLVCLPLYMCLHAKESKAAKAGEEEDPQFPADNKQQPVEENDAPAPAAPVEEKAAPEWDPSSQMDRRRASSDES